MLKFLNALFSGKPENLELRQIPDFTLNDQNNNTFRLSQHMGKRILIIYFYPKNESMICTKESCSFRDSYAEFSDMGAMVIGINNGSVDSHRKFQQKHRLPFTLLSDPEDKIFKLFGLKNTFGLGGRETFIIDLSGELVFKFNSAFNAGRHIELALEHVRKLNNQSVNK